RKFCALAHLNVEVEHVFEIGGVVADELVESSEWEALLLRSELIGKNEVNQTGCRALKAKTNECLVSTGKQEKVIYGDQQVIHERVNRYAISSWNNRTQHGSRF